MTDDPSPEHDLQPEVIQGDPIQEIAPDLAYKRLAIVNVAFFGLPSAAEPWVLIDAGLPQTAHSISKAAEERFGHDAPPAAIILTHGHFDHVGALESLASRWDVPIYAHPLELPYLNGRSAYPPPDPSVGGGLMARLSAFYPKGPIDVSRWLQPLPEDGSVPGMPGWRWLHTPGHAPGHVSLWREADRLLVAGDAFVTTRQESAYAVAVQKPELHGPPMYFTPDWVSARASVEALAALEPETVVTGHGPAMQGSAVRTALHHLADNFEQLGVPDQGRYVNMPARADEDGTTYVPEKTSEGIGTTSLFLDLVLLGIAGYLVYLLMHKEATPNDRELAATT
jgi:glyoxylase-like metal-dependent hydrolase (beta-lactamase superfamily II)